jgi:hypothetical protein
MDTGGAHGHLNHGALMERGFTSLSAVGGFANLVATSADDVRGELQLRLVAL